MASRRAAYWCHQCDHTVRIAEGEGVSCPCCGGGFVEEVSPSVGRSRFGASPSPLHDFMTAMDSMVSAMRHTSIEGGDGGGASIRPRRGGSGAGAGGEPPGYQGVLIVRGGGGAGGDRDTWQMFNGRGRLTTGDGVDFERLVQQLLESEPGNYGTPPATRATIEGVARVRITREHLAGDNSACAVCKDDFALGTEVRQLPCTHLYHQDCIVPWLSLHGSCPVCRHEITADAAAGDEEAVRSSSRSSSMIPWPFRRRG